MGRIDEATTSIWADVDYRAQLEKYGADAVDSGPHYVMIQCPFHDDSNPSLSVSLKTGSWRCFACHTRGNWPKLVAELLGIEVVDVYKHLDDTPAPVNGMRQKLVESLQPKQQVYFDYGNFRDVFPSVIGTKGEAYLKGRGITKDMIRRFDLRWGTTGKWVDRVMIPIFTHNGRLISYAGRTIHPGVKPKTRKCRSPHKTLYGVYELGVQFTASNKPIVIVEGEFDAMYLQRYHVPAVAQMGTHELTPSQIQVLRSLTKTVVLSYDGDEAGESALAKSMEVLGPWFRTIAIRLPEGRDPNDLTPKEVKQTYAQFVTPF